MSRILIPFEKLQDGFEKCRKQVELLLAASETLYAQKQYVTSYPLVVLAYEEIAKLKLIQLHLDRKEGITTKDWERLTKGGLSHKNKLVFSYLDAQQRFIGREAALRRVEAISRDLGQIMTPSSYKQITTLNPDKILRLERMDKMKQECFYVGWDGTDWTSFNHLTETEQEALSYEYMIQAKLELNILKVHNKHPVIHHSGPEYERFKAEPEQEVIRNLIRIKESDEYKQKVSLAHKILGKQIHKGPKRTAP